MSYITLNNGLQIPSLAHGAGLDRRDPEFKSKCKAMLKTAIEAGYRHIDTSYMYITLQGTEQEIGEAIKESGIPRELFFVTTKLPLFHQHMVAESFDESLKNLGMDYVDMYLIHAPQVTYLDNGNLAFNGDGTLKTVDSPTFNDSYAEMEKIYATGKVKAIGVSNFSIKTLNELLKTANVVPAVNQVEMHPFLAQNELVEFHREKGITTEAYSATGSGDAVRNDATLQSVAVKHGTSTTQVMLAWHVGRGVVSITKSSNPDRQKDNLRLPTLDEEDMSAIATLDRGERINSKIDQTGGWMGWSAARLGW